MEAPLLDAKINHYKQKIIRLDSLSNKLPEKAQIKYRAERRRFEQRLDVWQKTLGSDLAVFNSNVSEGYHKLESYLLNSK